ncbi:hypothetical protein [Streptomyces sp. NPDC127108]
MRGSIPEAISCFADPAQSVHRVHNSLPGPGERLLQCVQFVEAADEQPG